MGTQLFTSSCSRCKFFPMDWWKPNVPASFSQTSSTQVTSWSICNSSVSTQSSCYLQKPHRKVCPEPNRACVGDCIFLSLECISPLVVWGTLTAFAIADPILFMVVVAFVIQWGSKIRASSLCEVQPWLLLEHSFCVLTLWRHFPEVSRSVMRVSCSFLNSSWPASIVL